MDKKFLKEQNLYEAHKQFMKLCEWSYVPTTLEEDDEEEEDVSKQPEEQGEQEMMGNGQMDSNDMPQMDDQNMSDGSDEDTAAQEGPMVDNQGDDMDGQMVDQNAIPPMDVEDETVIDVDDITNAQEKMNDKVNVVGQDLGKVDDKIEQLLQSLNAMQTMIDNNNQEIANFKAEFEKRNPTQTEKLNLRSLDSYPFNVNPKDYWTQKGYDPNSNYSGFSNNDMPTKDEYVITNNDVDDFSDREMEKSFDIDDDFKQDINKIFGL